MAVGNQTERGLHRQVLSYFGRSVTGELYRVEPPHLVMIFIRPVEPVSTRLCKCATVQLHSSATVCTLYVITSFSQKKRSSVRNRHKIKAKRLRLTISTTSEETHDSTLPLLFTGRGLVGENAAQGSYHVKIWFLPEAVSSLTSDVFFKGV